MTLYCFINPNEFWTVFYVMANTEQEACGLLLQKAENTPASCERNELEWAAFLIKGYTAEKYADGEVVCHSY